MQQYLWRLLFFAHFFHDMRRGNVFLLWNQIQYVHYIAWRLIFFSKIYQVVLVWRVMGAFEAFLDLSRTCKPLSGCAFTSNHKIHLRYPDSDFVYASIRTFTDHESLWASVDGSALIFCLVKKTLMAASILSSILWDSSVFSSISAISSHNSWPWFLSKLLFSKNITKQ